MPTTGDDGLAGRKYLSAALLGDIQSDPALLLVRAFRAAVIVNGDQGGRFGTVETFPWLASWTPFLGPSEPEALTLWYGEQSGWNSDGIKTALLDLRYDVASQARQSTDPVRQLCTTIDELITDAMARAAVTVVQLISAHPSSDEREWILLHVGRRCRIDVQLLEAACDRQRFDQIVASIPSTSPPQDP